MGGIIASSLAFYILFFEKLINKNGNNYNNAFKRLGKKSMGVVTFGSPSFLFNLSIVYEMEKFVSYFINIKEEFDYIPALIDFINFKMFRKVDSFLSLVLSGVELKKEVNYYPKTFMTISQKMNLDNREKIYLYEYSQYIGFTPENLIDDIKKFKS